jgi:hypothetical protein
MTLADVPLPRRAGAALNVIGANPHLTVEERGELLAAALWPPCEVSTPNFDFTPSRHSTVEERRDAVALRHQGVSEAEVASRYAVAKKTVRQWVHDAKRGRL